MKKKALIKKILAFWCVILAAHTVHAQEKYSLQQCIDLALKQSLQLKSDALDLDKTNAGIKQAYSALLPNITANGSYQYSFEVTSSIIPAEAFGGPVGVYNTSKLGVPQTKSASLKLNQTLYNPSALIGLKAAKILVAGNQLQIKNTKEDLVYNISATYYNIQSQIKQQELTGQSLANTEALLQNTTEQLKAGLATQTDVDRLTVTRDNTKANLQSLQNSNEKYYTLLKLYMNMPLEQKISVDSFAENETAGLQIINFNPLLKTNYLQVLQNKKIGELQYKNIKAGLLPTVSLYADYGQLGYNSNADPFKNINNRFYPTSDIGIKISVPIFDGFSIKYQAKQKQIEVKKYDVQAEQTLQQNNKDVADARADFRNNLITYENQKRNLVLAQKVMDDINQQYTSGIVKVNDVINTTSDLQTAQLNYVSALINIKQAEINLKKAQGILISN